MKLLVTILLALNAAVVMATVTLRNTNQADCDRCKIMYEYCVKNGHTQGQTGCKYTCRDRACDQNIGCREQCGEEFAKCPENRRWHN